VSTPITWDEVAACRHTAQLVFTADEVLDRVDLLLDLREKPTTLPSP
jgi:bifunctional non-homologous end joining protein LigD